jgi:hypothetical protein
VVSFVIVGGLLSLLEGRSETVAALMLSVGQAVVVGALTSYLGAAQMPLFRKLSAAEASAPDPAGTTEETASPD